MERYFMEPSSAGYVLFDRRRDPTEPVARIKDPELAQRIVNLLNADAARLERQGAVAS